LHVAKIQFARYSNLVYESVNTGLRKVIDAWSAYDPSKLRFATAVQGQAAKVSGVERSRDSKNPMLVVHVA
jgi:hypothetical protein